MNLADFNQTCGKLPRAHRVVQWGGTHVWKIGSKVFALAREEAEGALHVTFKVSWTSFEILKQQAGVRPAPYLASRGMSWVQRTAAVAMSDEDLRARLAESYALVMAGLSQRAKVELGLEPNEAPRRCKTRA